ncbi:beta-ketoacyl-ACP synthase III [Limibacter armeniacum]|uniref:beta-ketoacyl-ACP synthase III n=1 Tax=Limibacter armeniacum TaxID=466084 RepID=UPI002FE67FCA
MKPINAAITAVAGWVPDERLTNQDLERLVETNDDWIVSRTGIKERRILNGNGRGTSEMAIHAVKDLLVKRGIEGHEVDLIVCATATPDMGFVSTANIVAEAIGCNAMSLDISAACSGFLYGLEMASNFIRSGTYKKVVVIGADKMSSVIDYKDRNSCILFGDGAGAALLEPDEEYGIVDATMYSDGSGKNMLNVKRGGSAYPLGAEDFSAREHYFYQDGKNVFRHAVTKMADVAAEVMEKNNLTGEDVAWLIPHQANKRIIEATAQRMNVGMDKVAMNISQYGNTTGATIPLCLWEWEKNFKKGDNLILAAFGGGFTWGAIYLKWAY